MESTLTIAMRQCSGQASKMTTPDPDLPWKCPLSQPSSSHQLLHHLAAIDDLDGPVAGGHEFLVGDNAKKVVDGGGEILRTDRVTLGLTGRRVRGAVDIA